MTTFSRVSPTGWSQGDDATSFSRVAPIGWEQLVATASVTIYRPTSDISTGGWVANVGGSLYAAIDEVTADDADYITSPDLATPTVLGIPALVAGTYDIRFRSNRDAVSGSVRALLLDGSGATLGTSAWQAITATIADYTLSVTIAATATQLKFEVSP